MRRFCLVALLAPILMLVKLHSSGGSGANSETVEDVETTIVTRHGIDPDESRRQIIAALVTLSTYEERLTLACKTFSRSDATEEDLLALLQVAGDSYDPAAVIAGCELDEDTTEDLLNDILAYRVEAGDRDAAKLAFTIAGSECADTPGQIDRGCADMADEHDWDVVAWRSCSRSGFRSYRRCALDVLTDYGVDSKAVDDLYIGRIMRQTGSLVHAAKDGSADPAEVIDELISRARDRVLVETIASKDLGPMSFTIVALSQNLSFQQRPELHQQLQPVLEFWSHRCNLEYSPPSISLEVDDVLLTYTP